MHPCLSLNVQSNPDYRGMTACDKSAFHPIPIAPNGARREYVEGIRFRSRRTGPGGGTSRASDSDRAERGQARIHPRPTHAYHRCCGRRDGPRDGVQSDRGPWTAPRDQALCRYVMRPRVRSYGDTSTVTRSPSRIRMRKRRSLPAMVARTAAPLSRVTRNDVLGRTSVTVPSSSIRSSLEIRSSGCWAAALPIQLLRLTYLEAGVQIQAGLDPTPGADPLGQIEPDQPVHEGSPYASAAHRDYALVPAVPVAGPAEVAEDDGFGEDAAQSELEAREPVGVADRGADVLAAHRGRAAEVPEPLHRDVPARRPAAQRECRGDGTGER